MHDSTTTTPISNASDPATNWRLADVIDFEFLLEQDHDLALTELEKRDHRIFQQQILPQSGLKSAAQPSDRRSLFRSWLAARRQSCGTEQLLPGKPFVAAWRVLLKLIALVGLVLGAGAAANLLHYDGQQPVNVAAFLGWLVLVQIIVVLVAGGILLLRKTRFLSTETAFFASLIRSLWSWLAVRINRHALDRVSADQRTRFASFLGATGQHRSVYGEVAMWPVVGSLQLFGVCFNVGALLTTIALVMFSDRAFGWQSAVEFSPQQIHQLVQTLAMPWSWAVSNAAPTLEQIVGSKIVLKDGIKQLATGNLVSWWPFLCMALAVYGLLPRAILWMLTLVFGTRALRQLSFDQVACDRLHDRLQTSRLETAGQGAEDERTTRPANGVSATDDTKSNLPGADSTAVALISAELMRHLDLNRFSELIQKRFHLSISQTIEWSDETSTARKAIERLQNIHWNNGTARVVLLEEAWQPPIAEKLNALRALRDALSKRAKILVVLIGRPNGSDLFTVTKPREKLVWERQIKTLGDTQLRLEQLIEHE